MELITTRLRDVRPFIRLMAFLVLLIVSYHPVHAQQLTVTGKVLSAKDQTPLPGASIKVTGTSRGITSAADGSFTIKASVGARLSITMVGYLPKDVKVTGSNLGVVSLEED